VDAILFSLRVLRGHAFCFLCALCGYFSPARCWLFAASLVMVCVRPRASAVRKSVIVRVSPWLVPLNLSRRVSLEITGMMNYYLNSNNKSGALNTP